jgi:PII-like signaling protein
MSGWAVFSALSVVIWPPVRCIRFFPTSISRLVRQPLYEWIVRKAREFGLAGATVFRGLEGFGAHSRVHTAKILRLSSDLPIVIEIVDASEKIEQFMPIIDDAIKEGLATLEKATIRFYRSGKS